MPRAKKTDAAATGAVAAPAKRARGGKKAKACEEQEQSPPPAIVAVEEEAVVDEDVEIFVSDDGATTSLPRTNENENIILQLQIDPSTAAPTQDSMTFEEAFYTYDPRIEVPDAFEQANDFSSKPCMIQDGAEQSSAQPQQLSGAGKAAKKKGAAVPASDNNKKTGSSRVYDHLAEFLSRDDWPIRTDMACFWCCHTFTNTPFGLPVKYINGRFHVHGCFCSLECSAAYNFYSVEFKHDVWESYHLINLLAKKINYKVVVKMAPPRQCLKLFGGYMDIAEFRQFCDSGKLINTHNHPMVAMSQQLEEINDSEQYHHRKNMFIPVDKQKLFMLENKVKLERTKPLYANKNTLDHAMNLKIEA